MSCLRTLGPAFLLAMSCCLHGSEEKFPHWELSSISLEQAKDEPRFNGIEIKVFRAPDFPPLSYVIRGGNGSFIPVGEGEDKWKDWVEGKDGKSYGYMVKHATKNHECGCFVITPAGGLIVYPSLNSWAEKQILATEEGKKKFGDSLDLGWCWIDAVSAAKVTLRAHPVWTKPGELHFEIALLPEGGTKLLSWKYVDDKEEKE